jgi:hypothetical protein
VLLRKRSRHLKSSNLVSPHMSKNFWAPVHILMRTLLAQLPENNHALTVAKMTAISSQVFVCGCEIPPPRETRMSAATRNATASAARMYFAATAPHVIFASSRCCRQAGALVLNSGVPGSRRHK